MYLDRQADVFLRDEFPRDSHFGMFSFFFFLSQRLLLRAYVEA